MSEINIYFKPVGTEEQGHLCLLGRHLHALGHRESWSVYKISRSIVVVAQATQAYSVW